MYLLNDHCRIFNCKRKQKRRRLTAALDILLLGIAFQLRDANSEGMNQLCRDTFMVVFTRSYVNDTGGQRPPSSSQTSVDVAYIATTSLVIWNSSKYSIE